MARYCSGKVRGQLSAFRVAALTLPGSYMYGLDNNTNWEFGTYASNEFGHANWYSAIQCAMAILRA